MSDLSTILPRIALATYISVLGASVANGVYCGERADYLGKRIREVQRNFEHRSELLPCGSDELSRLNWEMLKSLDYLQQEKKSYEKRVFNPFYSAPIAQRQK